MIGVKSDKVLIVEDDMAMQPFWEIVLRRCLTNVKMNWAVSGEEAKRMIREARSQGEPYRLVVSDIFLAGAETGLDLMVYDELLKTNAKFILVSAADEDLVVENFIDKLSQQTVMTKPLNVPKCERTINALMGN